MAEGVLGGADVDVGEERESLDVAVLVGGVVGHVHVALADSLPLDATEVNGLLLRVVLDDLNDGESVDGGQVCVSAVPDSLGGRRVGVELHTHSWLLRTLTSEDIR